MFVFLWEAGRIVILPTALLSRKGKLWALLSRKGKLWYGLIVLFDNNMGCLFIFWGWIGLGWVGLLLWIFLLLLLLIQTMH